MNIYSLIRQLSGWSSEELHHSLSRSTGSGHFNKSEKQLLDLLQQLTVQYQNPAVRVKEYLELVLQQDQGVWHYLTTLKEVTARCNIHREMYMWKSSMMRWLKSIAGLYYSEIQKRHSKFGRQKLLKLRKVVKLKEKTVSVTNIPQVSGVKPITQWVSKCRHSNITGHGSLVQER